jgi:hypothetical protein
MCPTIKQNNLVDNLTGNYSTKKELLQASGYSESTASQPSRILETKGVQSLIEKAEAIGLDDDLCLRKVKEAIESRNINLAINTIFNFWRVKYPTEKGTNVNVFQQFNTWNSYQDVPEDMRKKLNDLMANDVEANLDFIVALVEKHGLKEELIKRLSVKN